MQKETGKSLVEIYEELPKTRKAVVTTPRSDFIERVASAARKSTMTVRGWLSKGIAPDELTQEAVSKELGVPASVLFPKKTTAC